jgi:hypothetical protein
LSIVGNTSRAGLSFSYVPPVDVCTYQNKIKAGKSENMKPWAFIDKKYRLTN